MQLELAKGIRVKENVIDTSRMPHPVARSYRAMYAYRNHFCVRITKEHLKRSDCGVAAMFWRLWRSLVGDANPIEAEVEYVGQLEEILEFRYWKHCRVIFVCNWIKANYAGDNATIIKDEWGFSLGAFNTRIHLSKESFTFPTQSNQNFYVNAIKKTKLESDLR